MTHQHFEQCDRQTGNDQTRDTPLVDMTDQHLLGETFGNHGHRHGHGHGHEQDQGHHHHGEPQTLSFDDIYQQKTSDSNFGRYSDRNSVEQLVRDLETLDQLLKNEIAAHSDVAQAIPVSDAQSTPTTDVAQSRPASDAPVTPPSDVTQPTPVSDTPTTPPSEVINPNLVGTDGSASVPSWSQFDIANNNFESSISPSYWAQKLPDNVNLIDANIAPAESLSADTGFFINANDYAPSQLRTVPIYKIDDGYENPMDRANGRTQIGTIQMPDGFVMPPNNRNNPFTLITADGQDISFNAYTRLDPTGPIWGVPGAGAHGGSYTSNVAAVTAQEVENAVKNGEAPQHKLQLTMWAGDISAADGGHTGPAIVADSGYQNFYSGSVPALKMGSTLAIEKGVTAKQLGLETQMGAALLDTLENYGGVVVDTGHGNFNYLGMTMDAEQQYRDDTGTDLFDPDRDAGATAFARDFQKLLVASKVVA